MEEKKLTMKDYVIETPKVVLENIERSKELTNKLVEEYLKKDFKRVVIVASGSSYNGSLCAVEFLKKVLKKEIKVISPFTFTYFDNDYDENDFIIVISQSGRSTNSIDAINTIKSKGLRTIGITGNVHSDFEDVCDVVVDYGVGIEKVGMVTKGVVTLTLFLMLSAVEIQIRKGLMSAEEGNDWKNAMRKSMDAHKQLQQSTFEFIEKHKKELTSMHNVWLISAGSNLSTIIEGALKIGESVKIHATAYESEEFLHGPVFPLNPDYVVFIYDTNKSEKASERIHQIYQGVKGVTDKVYMITDKPQIGEDVISTSVSIPEEILPLAYLAVAPLLAEYSSQALETKYHPLFSNLWKAVEIKTKKKEN
ncbi:MAG: SIS domain-containing protein [Erysipelotrichia bacterium]|nr:SIS domain-containing protein [Erysipelotrichia bacterium]